MKYISISGRIRKLITMIQTRCDNYFNFLTFCSGMPLACLNCRIFCVSCSVKKRSILGRFCRNMPIVAKKCKRLQLLAPQVDKMLYPTPSTPVKSRCQKQAKWTANEVIPSTVCGMNVSLEVVGKGQQGCMDLFVSL